ADYTLKNANDGKLSLMNVEGDTVATVDAPWAVDATGQHLPTYYELIPASNTIRQHVDTKGATYPIAVDPSWWWWTATAAQCAAAITPFLVTGGIAIAAKATVLISKINKLRKVKKFDDAVKKAGGAKQYALLKVKEFYNWVYSKSPNWVKKLLKSPSKLSQTQRDLLKQGSGITYGILASAFGLGSCYELATRK
ncbi:MAG: hypothetical protein J6M18_01055, partial [Actinomycetaceae bacterium]|nr:hypothetical protein [Actinomycetaceae bacterium]